jgi:chromate reductase, NAD(P)H dehydrogenase (quinone)
MPEHELATHKLLGICGALRAESSNRMLMREAARLFAPADFTEADLRLPLYDADVEAEGMPEVVSRLADQVRAADAIIISTPEYNKAPPGVLKNALDWISRVPGAAFAGKPVAIMSAAAGRAGGERSQYGLRWMLTPFNARVLTAPEILIPGANKAFDEAGKLHDEHSVALLQKLMEALRAEIRA